MFSCEFCEISKNTFFDTLVAAPKEMYVSPRTFKIKQVLLFR